MGAPHASGSDDEQGGTTLPPAGGLVGSPFHTGKPGQRESGGPCAQLEPQDTDCTDIALEGCCRGCTDWDPRSASCVAHLGLGGTLPWRTRTCAGRCTWPEPGSRAHSSCTAWRPRGTSPGRKTPLPETGHCCSLPASSAPGKIRSTGSGLWSWGRKQPAGRLAVAISSEGPGPGSLAAVSLT